MQREGGRRGLRLSPWDLHLLGVVLIWGFNYVGMKWALREVGEGPLTAVRYLVATPLMGLAAWAMHEPFRIERRDLLRVIWVGLVGITLYPNLFAMAVERSTSANVALLLALSPIFTGLFEGMAGRLRLTGRFALGTLVAMAGTGLTILYGGGHLDFSLATLKGDLIGLIASVIWGYYPSVAQPLLQRYSPIAVQFWMMVVGCLGLLVWQGVPTAQVAWGAVSGLAWFGILFLAIPATVYAQIVWYGGVKVLSASHVMSYMYVVPVAAAAAGALVLHERVYAGQALGAIVALYGVYLVRRALQGVAKATDAATPTAAK